MIYAPAIVPARPNPSMVVLIPGVIVLGGVVVAGYVGWKGLQRKGSLPASFSSKYPLSTLTVSSSAQRLGLSNQPATEAHQTNLARLSQFLLKIPYPFTVTSGYRAPDVNAAVGGAGSSQHMNGLAADIVPTTVSNEQLAAWFYAHQNEMPELDQVIWYTDTGHVHVGICPDGGTDCASRSSPRRQFLYATKEGATYWPWAPTATEQAQMALRVAAGGAGDVLPYVLGASAIAGVALLGFWWWTRRSA